MLLCPGIGSGADPDGHLLCGEGSGSWVSRNREGRFQGSQPSLPSCLDCKMQRLDHNRRRSVWPSPEPPPQDEHSHDTGTLIHHQAPNPFIQGICSDPLNYYSGEMQELLCSRVGKKQSNTPRTMSSWWLAWIIFGSGLKPHQATLAPWAGSRALLCVLKALRASLYLCTHLPGLWQEGYLPPSLRTTGQKPGLPGQAGAPANTQHSIRHLVRALINIGYCVGNSFSSEVGGRGGKVERSIAHIKEIHQ